MGRFFSPTTFHCYWLAAGLSGNSVVPDPAHWGSELHVSTALIKRSPFRPQSLAKFHHHRSLDRGPRLELHSRAFTQFPSLRCSHRSLALKPPTFPFSSSFRPPWRPSCTSDTKTSLKPPPYRESILTVQFQQKLDRDGRRKFDRQLLQRLRGALQEQRSVKLCRTLVGRMSHPSSERAIAPLHTLALTHTPLGLVSLDAE